MHVDCRNMQKKRYYLSCTWSFCGVRLVGLIFVNELVLQSVVDFTRDLESIGESAWILPIFSF